MSFGKGAVRMEDLKGIEGFLMGLPEVLDASVWISHGKLRAHLTVPATLHAEPASIRAACEVEIGSDRTPDEVVLLEQ